jgi:GNAT superfamily N-acetyltransferase
MALQYEWRGPFANREFNELHAEAFGHPVVDDDWASQVDRHSLGWVCARDVNGLAGFVNVSWDGAHHAFILDTLVALRARRQGIGTRLVTIAAQHAREAGCEWLHVDFAKDLTAFYLDACGFTSTCAGLIEL